MKKAASFLFLDPAETESRSPEKENENETKQNKKFLPRSDDDEGFVTFTSWFKVTGQVGSRQDGGDAVGTMSERSLFVRVPFDADYGNDGNEEQSEKKRGKWLYREGTPVINGVPRVLS